jgi:hypothetical protein
MKLLKQSLGTLGALLVLAAIVALVAPQRVHAVAAALVQIIPGNTTHVGQNESQLVSLACFAGRSGCQTEDPSGVIGSSAYQVPSGYTLVITDYEWSILGGSPNIYICDAPQVPTNILVVTLSCAVSDKNGVAYSKEHFATGLRAGSGQAITDFLASNGIGTGAIQGYLVPND